jgi:Domain of unknown function (DUF4180)
MNNGDIPRFLANGDAPAAPSPRIDTAADISAALGASVDQGGLLLDETQLSADFFDLRTGLAGQVLQKFTNYRARLAIVITDASVHGSRFRELVYEHRTHNAVRFFESEQLARRWLAYNPVVKC